MRKYYSEPVMDVKKYAMAQTIYMTTSGDLDPESPDENNKDLGNGDGYDYFN